MLVVATCLLAVLSPLVAGRWPAGLMTTPWKWPWLVWAVLIFQAVVLEVPMPDGVAPVLHIGTYAAAIAFLWLNRKVNGAWWVAAGAACNGLVIALNGGTLPARPEAVAAAGNDQEMAFANAGVVENPVLPWLGDAFAWPEPMPLANTFSIGDVLIVAGVAIAAWTGARRLGQGPVKSASVGADPGTQADTEANAER